MFTLFRKIRLQSPNQNSIVTRRIFLFISLFLVSILFALADPLSMPFLDDSAIIMRYLVNFQKGYFFTYNIADGPVFGISSFWYGLATGFLSFLGLAPEVSLITVSFIASVFLFNTLLHLFYTITQSLPKTAFLFIFLCTGAYFNLPMLFAGLEVPLHLFFITSALLAFFKNNRKGLYIFAAICIISKLDSAFLMGGLILLDFIRNYKNKGFIETFKEGFLYCGLPLLIWVFFATYMFGSPLPASFLSKMFFRAKAPDDFFIPFLLPFVSGKAGGVSSALGGIVLLIAFATGWHKKNIFLPSVVLALAFFGTIGLYAIYNPGERMPWYYTLPELLFLMAVGLTLFDTWKIDSKKLRWSATALTLCLVLGVSAYRFPLIKYNLTDISKEWTHVYEKERRDLSILANKATLNEEGPHILWNGHGYPAYLFDGYVVDYAGLNFNKIWDAIHEAQNPSPESKAFLKEINLETAPEEAKAIFLLIDIFKPTVFVQHNLFPKAFQRNQKIRTVGSFYAFDLLNAHAMRVIIKDSKNPELSEVVAQKDLTIEGDASQKGRLYVKTSSVRFPVPAQTTRLSFGVQQTKGAFQISLKDQVNLKVLGVCDVPALPDTLFLYRAHACEIPFNALSYKEKRTLILDVKGQNNAKLFEIAWSAPLKDMK